MTAIVAQGSTGTRAPTPVPTTTKPAVKAPTSNSKTPTKAVPKAAPKATTPATAFVGSVYATGTGGVPPGGATSSVNGAITTPWQNPAANEPLSNLPFDARGNRIAPFGRKTTLGGSLTGGNLGVQSGLIFSLPGGGQNPTTGGGTIGTIIQAEHPGITIPTFYCYFRYNPTEIDSSYGFDQSVIGALNPSYVAEDAQALGTTGTLLNQSWNLSLLFDRTYELWSGAFGKNYDSVDKNGLATGGGPFKWGVLWDVWALERILGVYGQSTGAAPSGPPASTPVQVNFNLNNFEITENGVIPNTGLGGLFPATSGAWCFQGWITEFSVQYTRFDANMVPSRCAVSLSFAQIYSVQSITTSAPVTASSSST